jgi:hypothetical protein
LRRLVRARTESLTRIEVDRIAIRRNSRIGPTGNNVETPTEGKAGPALFPLLPPVLIFDR